MDTDQLKKRGLLHHQILQSFSNSDLSVIINNLGIDEENLAGDTKPEKILNLVLEVQRAGRLKLLMEELKAKRPNINWDQYL